jgi:predicted Zn-dependent peptidase
MPELLWPEGHPYHHPVIGAHEDLQAATVGDVKEFFATWYDPANASLAVAGDFDPKVVAATVDKWFSTLPSRGKPADPGAPGFSDTRTTLTSVVRKTVNDNVQLAKVTVAWQSPRHYAPGDAELDLVASVLAHGKASRLYKSLVYDQKIAQDVSARQESRTLGSDFVVDAIVRPGVDPAKVEKALLDQVALVREKGVTAQELARASAGFETDFVERLESVAERASLLNMYEAEVGDPGYIQADLERYRRATPADLLGAVKKVLVPDALVVLTILPKKGGS